MLADLQTYLPCDLLAKVDIASMAHGLECRSPFMDHHVVELAASIPFQYHLDRSFAKPILTRTFPDLIPREIAARPKMGFSIPLNSWLRGNLRPLVRELLQSGDLEERNYFSQTTVDRLVSNHFEGRGDYSQQIWALLCLEQWHRTFVDPPTSPAEMPTYDDLILHPFS
jgi:asparagine synthase (glutamine-hydrolysing)